MKTKEDRKVFTPTLAAITDLGYVLSLSRAVYRAISLEKRRVN